MKLPKALMEAINETTDALEQAACGLLNLKSMSLVAEWNDSNDGNYLITLTNDDGGYSDWDIDVEPIAEEPPAPPAPAQPTKAQTAATKAVATGNQQLQKRAIARR